MLMLIHWLIDWTLKCTQVAVFGQGWVYIGEGFANFYILLLTENELEPARKFCERQKRYWEKIFDN